MNSNAIMMDSGARDPVMYWPLPVAIATWIAVMWGAGYFLAKPSAVLISPPSPIQAQIVQLPPDHPPPLTQPKHIVQKSLLVKKRVIKRHIVHHKKVVKPPVKKQPQPPHPAQPAPHTELMGARAIYKPLPVIPDDLRDASINTVAVAQFHINTDGTATVKLIQPTPDPRINQVILATLKTWRFFPAMRDGKPIPSLQDIKVAVNVD